MATQTQQMASFLNGAIVFSADFNDANGRISGIRCINNSDRTAFCTVANRVGNSFSFSWAPQTTAINSVPALFGSVFVDNGTGETILGLDASFGHT